MQPKAQEAQCGRYSDDQLRELARLQEGDYSLLNDPDADPRIKEVCEHLGGAEVVLEIRGHLGSCFDCQEQIAQAVNNS